MTLLRRIAAARHDPLGRLALAMTATWILAAITWLLLPDHWVTAAPMLYAISDRRRWPVTLDPRSSGVSVAPPADWARKRRPAGSATRAPTEPMT